MKKLCSNETRALANTTRREWRKVRLEWMGKDMCVKEMSTTMHSFFTQQESILSYLTIVRWLLEAKIRT